MADRFPLILNTSANQIQEIASGDQLDLSGNNIANAGIITASSFSGPVVASGIITAVAADIDDFVDVGSNIQLGNAGIITATGADINGDLDVDGHTNLDNASIAGVTTFADNAKAIFGTGGDLEIYHTGSGSVINDVGSGSLHLRRAGSNRINIQNDDVTLCYQGNVKLATTNTGINVTGNAVATGADINGDLDVDGHTNLDNVSVAGVSTFAGAVTTGDHVTLSGQNPRITFTDSNHNPDYELYGSAGNFKIWDSTSNVGRLVVNSDGHIDIPGNLDCGAGIDVTGNATVSGNLSVGGVLTYEDVTNVDSVGIVTARLGVFIPDNNELKIGNTAGSPDTKIFHNGVKTRLVSTVQYDMDADIIDIHNASANAMKARFLNNQVELYHNNVKRFETTSTGIKVTGTTVTGSEFLGDFRVKNTDNSNFITFKPAENLVRWHDNDKAVFGNSNDLEIYHNGSHSFIDSILAGSQVLIRTKESGGTVNNAAKFMPTGAVELYYDGSMKFNTITGGAVVTGDLGVGDASNPSHQYDQGIHVHANGTGAVLHLTDSTSGSGTGDGFDIISHAGSAYLWQRENANMIFGTQGTSRWSIYGSNGHFAPNANNTYDIGTTSSRVRNLYVNDLQLSNKGKKDEGGNDVDGTWGDYTIQEGESDLYLINNRSGKKYKFNLTEVS